MALLVTRLACQVKRLWSDFGNLVVCANTMRDK